MQRKLTIENMQDETQRVTLEFDMGSEGDPAPWVNLASKRFREKYPTTPFRDKDIRLEPPLVARP